MRRGPRHLVVAFACLISAAAFAEGDRPPSLRYDPFRQPEVTANADGPRSGRGEADDFQPVLRSTIIRGKRSLVNLGGEILAVGESTHGYRLVSVRPFEATFVKDGARVKLEVTADEEARR